ncbi:MAG: radical SAM protein [Candidatus Coatesbacteria bacterium]|nr:radical SAM protein [Candidatus Coatesbacteria bacterium]
MLNRKISAFKNDLKMKFNIFVSMPKMIFFVVTNRCNMKCIMCDVGRENRESQFYKNLAGENEKQDLDLDRAKTFIESLGEFKPVTVICASEPLLYKNLHELIKMLKKQDLRVEMLTNGFLLYRHAENILNDGLDMIHISIDGIKEIHDSIRRVEGCYEKIIEGLNELIKLKNEMNSKIEIDISFTITHLNYLHIKQFYDIAKDWNVDRYTFFYPDFVTADMAAKHNSIFGNLENGIYKASESNFTIDDLKEIDTDMLYQQVSFIHNKHKVHILPNIHEKKDIEIYFKHHDRFLGRKFCTVPWNTMMILPNGNVVPESRCFHVNLGNIYEQNIREIWFGSKYKDLRKLFYKHKSFPICTRCCAIYDFRIL